jgi:hypothetical protein
MTQEYPGIAPVADLQAVFTEYVVQRFLDDAGLLGEQRDAEGRRQPVANDPELCRPAVVRITHPDPDWGAQLRLCLSF